MKTPQEIDQRIASVEAQVDAAAREMNKLSGEVAAKVKCLSVNELLRPGFQEDVEAMAKAATEGQSALLALIASLEQLYWVTGRDDDLLGLQRQKLLAQAI
jgi:hypothetical protein